MKKILAVIIASSSLLACGNDDDKTPVVVAPIIPTSGYTTPLSYPDYTLVWQDEFDGTTLNESNWTHEIGNGINGWGNNELQYYKPENTRLLDGHLLIEAKKETFNQSPYTSSRIITKGKKEFKYGRIDIRAALPTGQGVWPALWMLGANINEIGWPRCGEIDIVELFGGNGAGRGNNVVKSTCHWFDNNALNPGNPNGRAQYGSAYTLSEGDFDDQFHVFTTVWTESSIRSFVDDKSYYTIDIRPEELSEFREKFFLIFNIAIGGDPVGAPDPGAGATKRMVVDYVRVFQAN
jgi:beta-glucanase (GH16 family)